MTPLIDEADLQRLIDWLARFAAGQAHAKPAKAIKLALQLDDRYLRALAAAASERGILVAADNAGYFIPAGRAEVDDMLGRLRSQAVEMNRRIAAIERLRDRVFPIYGTQPTLMDLTPPDVPARRPADHEPTRQSSPLSSRPVSSTL